MESLRHRAAKPAEWGRRPPPRFVGSPFCTGVATMVRSISGLTLLLAFTWLASAVAQTPGTTGKQVVLAPVAATSGHGVSNAVLLNQSGVRVLRVDVEPNGVRNVHSHDDVDFHLFVPVTGAVRLEAGAGQPQDLAPWQAQYLKGGTRHGFTNTGTSTATVMEVFVMK